MANKSVYWWRGAGNKNFGDVLGPELVTKFSKYNAVWAPAAESELVVIGSILEHLPKDYEGTVAGIGVAHRKTKKSLASANVLALRGMLSWEASGIKDVPLLADPGLIATDLIKEMPEKQYGVGIISHYSDSGLQAGPNDFIIDIRSPIEEVIINAAKCEKIITSSLHGLILADALGLPRMWKKYSRVQGHGYKFHDYSSSLGQRIRSNTWDKAPERIVKEKQESLREMFSCL
jgi:pyruvyltransferase